MRPIEQPTIEHQPRGIIREAVRHAGQLAAMGGAVLSLAASAPALANTGGTTALPESTGATGGTQPGPETGSAGGTAPGSLTAQAELSYTFQQDINNLATLIENDSTAVQTKLLKYAPAIGGGLLAETTTTVLLPSDSPFAISEEAGGRYSFTVIAPAQADGQPDLAETEQLSATEGPSQDSSDAAIVWDGIDHGGTIVAVHASRRGSHHKLIPGGTVQAAVQPAAGEGQATAAGLAATNAQTLRLIGEGFSRHPVLLNLTAPFVQQPGTAFEG